MSLAPGERLGPYELLGLLGAGGMGEVYRARDTRLDRDVAVKVLPAHLSSNPDTRARFEREARAISHLSHPHICTLYDIGCERPTPAAPPLGPQTSGLVPAEPVHFLVMEYLEGETLAARLARGPLPLPEVLRYGTEIASALDAAHRSGIVHRDLKPANVMLVTGGTARHGAPQAKLMDFGLARPAAVAPGAVAPTDSPTVSRPLTAEESIVGTLQYMAPEQLEGKESDARTDLWALGCVLYEMATGTPAFAAPSQASLIAAILKEAPRPLADLQPLTPPLLERVVRKCLEKDPEERLQSARDIASELGWISSSGAGPMPSAPSPRPAGRRSASLAWVVAGVMTVAALALGAGALMAPRWARRPVEHRLVRFVVTAPAGRTVVTDSATAVISPDGTRLVFTLADPAGTPQLWIRPLDAVAAQPLPGTENAILPFWSPDSRFIAFFAEGKLQKVPVAGGSTEVICDAPDGRGGSWNEDGVIVFAPKIMGPLLRVSANGGEVVEVAAPDSARGETGLRFPSFLPDGRHFLYVGLPRRPGGFEVYLGALDSSERRRLMAAGRSPTYAEPGYLLMARGEHLVAQRFDQSRLLPVGDLLPLGDVASSSTFDGAPALSASANGVLAHVAASSPETQLVWLDRTGRPVGTIPLPPGHYENPMLSPDSRWAAVTKATSPTTVDLWAVDLQRAVPTRLTFGSQAAPGGGANARPLWSRDGSRIAFQDNPSGPYDIYQVPANGAGRPEPIIQSNVFVKSPAAWTPDGKYLVFSQVGETTGWDLWLLPLTGDRTPAPYLRTPFNEITAAISPDGRWLAYDSDETGTPEIYVRSFPVPGEKQRVSTAGGTCARSSSSGRELLIWGASQSFYGVGPVFSVDVETMPTFKVAGTPRVLFTPRPDLAGLAATSDLKRFLAAVPPEGASPASITVTLNWPAALRGR
jgi:serine/threonine protein kinase/Tol biopolymer transport system component